MHKFNSLGTWFENIALEKYTSWRVGGIGANVFQPKDADDLQATLIQIPQQLPITWLGLGSNTLIRDGGNPGVTVLTQGALMQLQCLDESTIKAQARVLL